MVGWTEFAATAPSIAEVFARRHQATGKLCMLATIRADGSPRISPMEPRIFEGHLTVVGMPGTMKFADLARDPRFCLHTATVDPHVGDGDAKLWATARDLRDYELHERFADALFAEIGLDLRGQRFEPFYVADITAASSVTFEDGQLRVTMWKPGEAERTVTK